MPFPSLQDSGLPVDGQLLFRTHSTDRIVRQ